MTELKDRRSIDRTPITTSWRAVFEYPPGQQQSALMIDLSEAGAGLLLYQAQPLGLAPGEQITVTTNTALGPSRCVAEVVWVDRVTAGIRFGVRFVEIAADDPLLSYADAPF